MSNQLRRADTGYVIHLKLKKELADRLRELAQADALRKMSMLQYCRNILRRHVEIYDKAAKDAEKFETLMKGGDNLS